MGQRWYLAAPGVHLLLLPLLACFGPGADTTKSGTTTDQTDTETTDTETTDTETDDTGPTDTETTDTGPTDTGPTDTGTAPPDGDGDGYDATGAGGDDCDDADAAISPDATEIWYDGVDQNCDGNDDDQDGDGFPLAADCDDLDAAISPAAAEIWYDGLDQDCDGASDYDADGDGQDALTWGADCDDGDAATYDGAPDAWYDGVDSNCDGVDDFDQDADGFDSDTWGGADCDDLDASVNPAAVEVWYDGVDQDCDANDDDQDGDGYPLADDCEDLDSSVNPAATEVWYDGVDQDCDGNDDDQDGDGYPLAVDCDDRDGTIYEGAPDPWYDGVDSNCDGASDFDQDGDLAESDAFGGDDCDDTDASVNVQATEIWYDGVDQDCDGNDDDQDGDGAPLADDCDDTDDTISPDADETWYDGIDQDCDGASDYDQDGDGEDAMDWGVDCDDTDPTSPFATTEIENGLDDDCDGTADEGFGVAGDIVITEVMANPSIVSDTLGEWFEVFNTTGADVDLVGWTIYGDDGNDFVVGSSLVVPAGGYAVLGVEDDSTTNGGVTVDYQYSRTDFSLSDTGDTIYLASGATTIAELSWTQTWPESSGVSMQLDDNHFDASSQNVSANWCASTEAWNVSDRGSPNAANADCTSLDDDADGYTTTDCDDDSADVSPEAPEQANGVDDNCNDYLDEDWENVASAPYLQGNGTYALPMVMGIADYDDDGENELLVMETDDVTLHLVSGPDYASWSGSLADNAEASFGASSTADDIRARSYGTGDVTGDGVADLVYAGVNTSAAFFVYAGPLGSGSANTSPTAYFEVTTDSYSTLVVESGYDFDGDGTNEVVFGNMASNRTSGNYGGSVGIFEVGAATGNLDWGDATVRLNGTGNQQCGIEIDPGDFDGDGTTDLSVGCYNDDIYLWLGDNLATTGTLTLSSVASTRIDYGSSTVGNTGVYSDDLDADGRTDIVMVYAETAWLLNPGATTGTILAENPDAVLDVNLFAGVAAYDSDGDGLGERVWADWQDAGTLAVSFAPGAGDDGEVSPSEASWAGFASGVTIAAVDAGDLDSDGDTEVIVGSVFPNNYTGALLVFEP